MSDADDETVKLVGEIVERAYRIADNTFVVDVPSASVIAERVDGDKTNVPDPKRGLFDRLDVFWKADVTADGEDSSVLSPGRADARLDVELVGILGRDQEHVPGLSEGA